MQFSELEALRGELRISQARLCRMADIHQTTYQRWLLYLHNREGGHCPTPRMLARLQSALVRELEQQPAR